MPASRKRIWRSVRWLGALTGLLVVFFVIDSMGLMYPTVFVTGDAMDGASKNLAGWRGVDCGRVKVRGDATLATQCALQANANARPFRVIYNIQGFDSIVAGAIVRTPRGKLFALNYDSCPSGCGFSLLQQRVQVTSCPEPYHLYVNPLGRINCFQQQLSYPKNLMSPNAEPY